MPVYQVGEHEILTESAAYVTGSLEAEDSIHGDLYLSDKRIVFERKGRRGLFRASAPQSVVEVYLHEVTNIYSAVPKIKVLTKKTLTIEYRRDEVTEKARFRVYDPVQWEKEVRKWIADSKRMEEERIQRESEERYRKKVELARAKAGTTNVGVAYYGKPNNESKPKKKSAQEDFIEGETQTTSIQLSKADPPANVYEATCPSCGEVVHSKMRFCPSCGEPLK